MKNLQKIVLNPPPLTDNGDIPEGKKLSLPEILSYREGSATKFSRKMRQKSLRRRFVILPTPFMHKTFRYPRFIETPKSSPRSFSVQWDKKIDRIVIPYYPKTIRYQNISERQASFYEYFRYCETKNSTKLLKPYYPKHFDARTFLKHRRDRPRTFSAIWDKQFPTEEVTSPSYP